jgi:hypothetical protein
MLQNVTTFEFGRITLHNQTAKHDELLNQEASSLNLVAQLGQKY